MVLCGSIWFHMVPYVSRRFQSVPHGPTWFHIFPHVDNEDKKGVCNREGCFIWLHPAAAPVQGGPVLTPVHSVQGGAHLPTCASMLAVTRLLQIYRYTVYGNTTTLAFTWQCGSFLATGAD